MRAIRDVPLFQPRLQRLLTWKRDGSEIGYLLSSLARKVAAAGEATFGQQWWASGQLSSVAWSSTTNDVLYTLNCSGLNKIDPSVQTMGTTIIPSQGSNDPLDLAWLTDGSGFVFVLNGDLYSATAQGTGIQQLIFLNNERAAHPSLSPGGQYIVFERNIGDYRGSAYSLWMMERTNPANMWQLVADGVRPDWSHVAPVTPTPSPTNTPPPNSTPTAKIYLPSMNR